MTRALLMLLVSSLAATTGMLACTSGEERGDDGQPGVLEDASMGGDMAMDMDLDMEARDPYDPVILDLPPERAGALLVAEERPQPNLGISALDLEQGSLERVVAIPQGRLLLDFDVKPGVGVVSSQLRASSPDGSFDTADLVLTTSPENTSSTLLEAPSEAKYIDPVFSPVENALLFVIATTDEDGILDASIVRQDLDAIENEPDRVVQDALEPDISSDGQQVAFIRIDPTTGTSQLAIAASDGANEVALTQPDDFHNISFALFSPDDAWLYFTALRATSEGISQHGEHSSEADWWRISSKGGDPERVLPVGENILGGAFAPVGEEDTWDLYFTTSTGAYLVSWPDPTDTEEREILQLLRARSLRAVSLLP